VLVLSDKNKNHVPLRMCLVCRQKFQQENLLRISFSKGNVNIYENGGKIGRGCYVCFKEKCINGLKKQVVENSLRIKLSDDEWGKSVCRLSNLLSQKI
jgi:predicted RNA-binding protein YlxR (DUF448 family)|tara:strand:+ start:68 stop:361 length:294 start_codon:yes stop_codon:yes gene_type:complete